MRCVTYWCILLCCIRGGAAIYNLALGKSGILTDGDNSTCQSYTLSTLRFTINLGKNSHIRSTRITFNESFAAGRTSIEYYDNSIHEWPYYVYKTHATEVPQTVEFDDQRTGTTLYFYIWDNVRSNIKFELCEIEVYGCEVGHFGSDCQPCTKDDKCVYCDVNDGDCYVCRHGYTGPNCSISTENVALKKYAYLYQYYLDYIYWPSYLMIDGDTTLKSCLDFTPFRNATIFLIRLALLTSYNIKDLRFHFIHEDDADIWFNYTIYTNGWRKLLHSGTAKISVNSTTVIIPFPQQVDFLAFRFYFVVGEGTGTSNAFFSLCELEVIGCPVNQYGSPCRPCPSQCGRCNTADGTCICQSGYTGENCAEKCSNNTYGINCVYSCGHCFNGTCDHVTGDCLFGCTEGWKSKSCKEACSSGWYGQNCAMRCSSHCSTPDVCDPVTGSCPGGCATDETCDPVDTVKCFGWAPPFVSVVYHNVTWRRQEELSVIRFDPAVTLMCNFSFKSDEDLLYDVTWFIDGLEVVNQTVDSSSNYTAVITAHDFLRAQRKIGSNVNCKVGAKRERGNVPCIYKVGNPFFAGIKIVNPSIELERKGSSNVELEMTIPFASESLYFNGVPQPVSNLNIHMVFRTDDSSTCSGRGSSNQCEVKVKGYSYSDRHKYQNGEWRQNISFPVYNQDTDGYVISNAMTLQLKTGGTNGNGSKIFEHVLLANVSIRVRDANNVWKGRSCGVRTDPHMYTFDGKPYECQIPGQFINYRNQRYLQWIQSKHHLCSLRYKNGPWCVCAVAARAGRDVFVIDLCGGSGVINFVLCEDNILKVVKVYDRHYKVYFPTGTTLSIYIMEWNGHYNIDLEIIPSAPDVGNADGLCGYFDGVMINDFRRRDDTFTDSINLIYPNDFSNSWRLHDSENLFSGDSSVFSSLESVSTILTPHCTCTDDGKTECSYSTFTPCSSHRGKQYTCNSYLVKRRRPKRDVPDGDPSATTNTTSVTTQEYAESVCLQAFMESTEYNLCQQHVTDLSNVTLSNCIEDIKITGDVNLTQIHVEAALQQCSTFVLLNTTLQESEPEVTHTIKTICPNNCSRHGNCEGGNCTCYSGYGGSDCSFDLLGPPTITDVPGSGLCDMSTTSCSEVTVLGKYFFEKMDSNCYISVHQIDINHSTIQEEHSQLHLEERTLFEGYCPLPFNTSGTWTTEITFNISNDGVQFTDTYSVFIYQSKCQEYHNESGMVFFTLKDEFCYIDDVCVSPMENSSNNECLICNATNNKYQWTENIYNHDCGRTTIEFPSTTTLDITAQSEAQSVSSTILITEPMTYSTTAQDTTDKQTVLSTQTGTTVLTDRETDTTTTETLPIVSSTTDTTRETSTAHVEITTKHTDEQPQSPTTLTIAETDTTKSTTKETSTAHGEISMSSQKPSTTDTNTAESTISELDKITTKHAEQLPQSSTTLRRAETDATAEPLYSVSTTTDTTKSTLTATETTIPLATTLQVTNDDELSTTSNIVTTTAMKTASNIVTTTATKTASVETTSISSEMETTSKLDTPSTDIKYTSRLIKMSSPSTESTRKTTLNPITTRSPVETTDSSRLTTPTMRELNSLSTTTGSRSTTAGSRSTTTDTRSTTTGSRSTTTGADRKLTECITTKTRVATTESAISTTERETKDTEELSHTPITNINLAVGVSASIFGLVTLCIIIGVVARSCRKSKKETQPRQENDRECRDWRDLVLSATKGAYTPSYYADSFVPHAPLHNFKSKSGYHRDSIDNRYKIY